MNAGYRIVAEVGEKLEEEETLTSRDEQALKDVRSRIRGRPVYMLF